MNTTTINTTMSKTKTLTTSALLAAILCLSAYISIPLGFTPTPLTLQTLVISLIAILLSPSASFATVLVYVLLGAIGVPVFSGGTGGIAKLLSPTGGYIFSFLLAAPLMSFTKVFFLKLFGKFIKKEASSNIIAYAVNAIIFGMLPVYLIGSAYMMITLGKSVTEVLMLAVIPFIPLDLVKCIIAPIISLPIIKSLNK